MTRIYPCEGRPMRSSALLLTGATALFAAVALAGRGAADDPKVAPGKGPEHKVLEQLVGRWNYTGTVYPEAVFPDDPMAQPVKLSGTMDSEFLSGSSWLVSKGRGKAGDAPYEFVTVTGYDSKKVKYTTVDINSLIPPPLSNDEGTYDEKSRTLSWTGTKVMPGSDQPATTKAEAVVKDSDTVVTTAYLKRPGSDKYVKWFDFNQKRRK